MHQPCEFSHPDLYSDRNQIDNINMTDDTIFTKIMLGILNVTKFYLDKPNYTGRQNLTFYAHQTNPTNLPT